MNRNCRSFIFATSSILALSAHLVYADIQEYQLVTSPETLAGNDPITTTGDVVVGDSGWGALEANGGSQLTVGGELYVGSGSDSHGNLDIRGTGTLVSIDRLFVSTDQDDVEGTPGTPDERSTGSVHVGPGATLRHTKGCCFYVGHVPDAVGTVNVNGGTFEVLGENLDWNSVAWGNIGRNGGIGVLNISNGGTGRIEFATPPSPGVSPEPGMNIGRAGDSTGIVRVTGLSTLEIRGQDPITAVPRGQGPSDSTKGMLQVSGGSRYWLDPNTGSTAYLWIARFPGTIGLTIVEGSGSSLDVGDGTAGSGQLCVGGSGFGEPCVDGGDGTLIVRDGGSVTACEITVMASGRQILDGGTINACTSTINVIGTMSVQGDSNIVGGLHLDTEGEMVFSTDENGNVTTLNVDGEVDINGAIIVELAEGVGLEDVPDLTLIESTDPDPTGTTNLIIQDSEGTTVASIEDVQVDELDTLSDNVSGGKAKVCHVRGNGKTKTIEIGLVSVNDHLAHGDSLGACD